VGVNRLVPPPSTQWSEKEIRFEKMRSSGPGGQHANKTETAIRATHLPSGLSAYAQEERSQYLNRKLAISRLLERLEEQQEKEHLQSQQKRWNQHNQLERGNPVRIYVGENFKSKNIVV
jgi:peptide chain release factor